jgi:hypothetical protein
MLYTGVKLGLSHYGRAHAEGTWRIFKPKLEGTGENCIMKSFMIGIAQWIFFG